MASVPLLYESRAVAELYGDELQRQEPTEETATTATATATRNRSRADATYVRAQASLLYLCLSVCLCVCVRAVTLACMYVMDVFRLTHVCVLLFCVLFVCV